MSYGETLTIRRVCAWRNKSVSSGHSGFNSLSFSNRFHVRSSNTLITLNR
ncbi:hypothetical protein Hanom_Chr13g01202671 [Helianthus anomalus]